MTWKTARNLRRYSQILFFLIFFWLILKTNFNVQFSGTVSDIKLPYPVSLFLEFDPLTALGTLLSSWSVYKGLLWSLVFIIPTFFLGRFFCGWICPLGSLNHWLSEIPSLNIRKRGKGKIKSNRYMKYQRIKYYILIFFLAAALMGTLQIGLLDPLPFLARSIGTVVLPLVHAAALGVVGFFKSIGWPPLGNAAQSVYDTIGPYFLNFRPVYFNTIFSLGFFFLIVMVLNRVFTRFWCRGICPLGALLGLASRYAIFGLKKDESTCNNCNMCNLHCQGADNPHVGEKWHQAECHLCLNCVAQCPENSLKFKFFPDQEHTRQNPEATQKAGIPRRMVLTSLAGGLAFFPFIRSGTNFSADPNPRLIRPPGAVDEKRFLERCIRCGQCMRVCPNNALHPTLMEAGVEGIWTPIMIPRIGYCEPSCTLCTQVCPTGAILELTAKQKVGDDKNPPISTGTAFFDRGRCLPWAMGKTCIVCEEWCPTSPKAIYTKEETTVDRQGNPVTIRRPYIDPALCTGCGACEYACPVVDKPAVYVTSIGESRHPDNQILLERRMKSIEARHRN